jgi:hypothetical protein
MASQKISQLTAITSVASGDYFVVVEASGTTNKRVEVGVLDVRYVSAASGVAAQDTANTALASGNEALVLADAAGLAATAALASGNAGISEALTKLPFSGGVVSGQFAQNIVPLGLYGSGIDCNLGNYFTAILSGDTQVVIDNSPSSVAYGFTYEVEHQTGTITWPTEVEWPAATAPTLTTGKTHLFMFVTDDAGTTWRASSLIDYNT